MAVDLGGGEVPAMRGLQRLVGEIAAGAGREEFGGGYVAGGVDVELDGYVDRSADGGASAGRNFGHDLIEDFAGDDGAAGGFSHGFDPRRIGDAGQRSSRCCWSRRTEGTVVVTFLRRR